MRGGVSQLLLSSHSWGRSADLRSLPDGSQREERLIAQIETTYVRFPRTGQLQPRRSAVRPGTDQPRVDEPLDDEPAIPALEGDPSRGAILTRPYHVQDSRLDDRQTILAHDQPFQLSHLLLGPRLDVGAEPASISITDQP